MKKVLSSVLIGLVIISSLVSCTSSNNDNKNPKENQVKVSTKEIVSKILDEVPMKKTVSIKDDEAKEKFHLNLEDLEDYSIENGVINTGLETIIIVKSKEDKVDSVKKSLEKVIEDKKESAFYPGEAEAVETTKIEVKGNYLGLFIIPDEENEGLVDKAVDIFESKVKLN